MASISPKG